MSATSVSEVLAEKRQPTWEFCAAVARALRVPPDAVFIRAGLKPPPPISFQEEGEIVQILRSLSAQARATVLTMLRSLAVQGAAGVSESPADYEPGDELTRMLIDEFDNLPEEWKQTAIEQVQWVRRLAERPPMRVLGEEEDGGQRKPAG